MDDKERKEMLDTLESQGKAIAMLAVRITTLEQILLEKKLITEMELETKALELSREFVAVTREALKKAAQEQKKDKTDN